MKILSVEEFKKNKYKVIFEDGSSLIVYKSRILQDTTQLNQDDINQLISEMLTAGKRYAMHLLAKKDYTRSELIQKLQKEGYEGLIQEKIMTYLDSFHYLDDIRYAGVLIRGRKEMKSKREIEYLLRQKGISEQNIKIAMESNYQMDDSSLNENYNDSSDKSSPEEAAIKRQLDKYHISEEKLSQMNYTEKQKIAAKLYRKGFLQNNICKIMGL